MRTIALAFFTSALMSMTIGSAVATNSAPDYLQHPGVVALSESSPGKWIYRKFPSMLRLYVSDADRPGESTCTGGCASAWPPVLANDDDKAVGDWTIIVRDGGAKQWAYKGQPAYLRFHDSSSDPSGDGIGGFRFLKP